MLAAEKNITYYLKIFGKVWEKREVCDSVLSLLVQLKYEKLTQTNVDIVTKVANTFFHRFYNPYKLNLTAEESDEENTNTKENKVNEDSWNEDLDNIKDENKTFEIIEGLSIKYKDETQTTTRGKLYF